MREPLRTVELVPFSHKRKTSLRFTIGKESLGILVQLVGSPMVDYTLPILVLDDHPPMVKLMTSLVRALGYEDVDSAPDATTALRMMQEKPYGLVISDIIMEPMGGIQFLRTARSLAGLGETRFLMTTASLNPNIVIAAKHAGADAYLLKPFTPGQLKAKLQEVLSHFPKFSKRV
jgi:two-component system, chemotaxis family, chemotaxis protein CheY